jgi:hypothetical protein
MRESYHIALRRILFNKNEMMIFAPLPSIEIGGDEIDPNFQWPEVIAIALNSVDSEFNPIAPIPSDLSHN